MRFTLIILASLAACSSAPPDPRVSASFIHGSNVIQVVVRDPKPVRGIRLVAPDGQFTPATMTNTDRIIGPPSSSIGIGIGGFGFGRGGGGGAGIGAGVPVGSGSQVQAVVTATIAPQSPETYRRTWQQYHVEVLIGDPPETVSLPAPAPS